MPKFGRTEAEELALEAKAKLTEFFQKDYHNEDAFVPARIAGGVFSACAKIMQAENGREALAVMVGRDLTQGDPKQFEEYLRVSLPGTPYVAAIPARPKTRENKPSRKARTGRV